MRISLKALHYLSTAIEMQSIKKASEKLHVVPSAISAAIDLIEDEMGLKLISRYPSRGIAPTETGKLIINRINILVDNYQALIQEGADVKDSLSGTLRIALGVAAAPAFVPNVIEPLMRNNSDISLKLYETNNEEAQEGLINGDFDAIIFIGGSLKPGLNYENLLEAPPHIVAPKGYFPADQKKINLDCFDKLPLILLNLPSISEYYRSLFDAHNINPKIVATAKTNEMVRSLVGAGIGCSILNIKAATNTTSGGDDTVSIPLEQPIEGLKLVLGYKEEYQRRLVREFTDRCRAYFKTPEAKKFIVY